MCPSLLTAATGKVHPLSGISVKPASSLAGCWAAKSGPVSSILGCLVWAWPWQPGQGQRPREKGWQVPKAFNGTVLRGPLSQPSQCPCSWAWQGSAHPSPSIESTIGSECSEVELLQGAFPKLPRLCRAPPVQRQPCHLPMLDLCCQALPAPSSPFFSNCLGKQPKGLQLAQPWPCTQHQHLDPFLGLEE